MLTRREALKLAGLGGLGLLSAPIGAACAPQAGRPGGAPLPPDAAWEERWRALVAAAEREGAVSLVTAAGDGYPPMVERFRSAFPGIRATHQVEPTITSWIAAAHRRAPSGAAAYDVGLVHSSRPLTEGRPYGLWAELRPALLRPDVIDDTAWRDGFAARFADVEGDLCFSWEYQVVHCYTVNTGMVDAKSIRSARDLLDSRWKGRIISPDPRSGTALLSAASVARSHGNDVVGRLLVDQRPVFLPIAGPELTEAVVRGDYPIALGVRPKVLNPLRAAGRGHNVAYLDLPDADFVGTNLLFVSARSAHPSAAAVFANWMLTQSAQRDLTAGLHTNSARTDVPPSEPDGIATPGSTYYEPEREANGSHTGETQRFVSGLPLKL